MRKFCFILTILMLLAFPSRGSADVAPPAQPPGTNPEPGVELTQVRMLSETVTIEVNDKTEKGSLGSAKVTASFTMRNLGSADESMAVRFPIGASDGAFNIPEITDMAVKVDGAVAALRQITGEDPNGFADGVPWVEFDVVFPVNRDVIIQASYTLEGEGELPFIWFNYIFSTGAGWKDSIGSATIYVRFPYEISELNVLPSDNRYGKDIFPEHQLSGTELKWTITDFEPEIQDNFKITIAAPSAWYEVLDERENIEKNALDGEAWGRLAKIYKELAFSSRRRGFRYYDYSNDPGVQELYKLSVQAYEKAIAIKVQDPLWHAGYADLLAYYSYHAGYEGIDTRIEAVRALKEIRMALEISEDNFKVREIADEMTFYLEGGFEKVGQDYTYPWLTATPELPTPTLDILQGSSTLDLTALYTPAPTSMVYKRTPQTATATEPVQRKPSRIPICGSAFLVPFGLILILQRRRK